MVLPVGNTIFDIEVYLTEFGADWSPIITRQIRNKRKKKVLSRSGARLDKTPKSKK